MANNVDGSPLSRPDFTIGDTVAYTIVFSGFGYKVTGAMADRVDAVIMSEVNDRGRVVVEDVKGAAHVIDEAAIFWTYRAVAA